MIVTGLGAQPHQGCDIQEPSPIPPRKFEVFHTVGKFSASAKDGTRDGRREKNGKAMFLMNQTYRQIVRSANWQVRKAADSKFWSVGLLPNRNTFPRSLLWLSFGLQLCQQKQWGRLSKAGGSRNYILEGVRAEREGNMPQVSAI